jgi:hypothetical protein
MEHRIWVEDDLSSLTVKHAVLSKFIDSDPRYVALCDEEKWCLGYQREAMANYMTALTDRLAFAEEPV